MLLLNLLLLELLLTGIFFNTHKSILAEVSRINPFSQQDFIFQQTMLRVKDPKKSLDFYTRILGMTWVESVCHDKFGGFFCSSEKNYFFGCNYTNWSNYVHNAGPSADAYLDGLAVSCRCLSSKWSNIGID